MAKIYSDKLPDCCAVCPCLDDLGFCELMNEWINKTSDGKHINCYTNRHPDCPIKPLSILEKQLEESESRFQAHKQTDVRTIQDQTDLIEQLKQQLATQENTITNLVEDNRASQEWYKKQLAEKELEIKKLIHQHEDKGE